jgi:hypothetical protein
VASQGLRARPPDREGDATAGAQHPRDLARRAIGVQLRQPRGQQRVRTDFPDLLRGVLEDLGRRRELRAGLDVERAADLLWALNDPALWQALVRERGWAPEEYEDWLTGALGAELLGRPPA